MAKKQLSDKEFWDALRKNAALYARTARAIQKEYGIEYSRQAVRKRAEKKPELLADIIEENLDTAEEVQYTLMRAKNENVRQRAVEFYLKTKGRSRGYVTQVNSDVTSNGNTITFTDFLMMTATVDEENQNSNGDDK